jgi:hypothetical protein
VKIKIKMDNFYVTLPSSSSQTIYPNNTLGDYTVQLSKEYNLDGEWEVALVEMFYPHTFKNISDGKNILNVSIGKGQDIEEYTVKVYPGYYANGEELADGINSAIQKTLPRGATDSLAFYFDVHSRTFTIFIKNRRTNVSAPEGSQIGEYTGMVPNQEYRIKKIVDKSIPDKDMDVFLNLKNEKKESVEKYIYQKRSYIGRVELNEETTLPTISTLWVYSDIADYSNVGKIMSPLLKIIHVRGGQRGKVIHETFVRPHYISVAKRTFHSINIVSTNSIGDRIDFQFGEVIVMLHFRRRKV